MGSVSTFTIHRTGVKPAKASRVRSYCSEIPGEIMKARLFLLAVIASLLPVSSSLSCKCANFPQGFDHDPSLLVPCEAPTCCDSGYITDRPGGCNCCPGCAKAEGEGCGGRWNTGGDCAPGLKCVRVPCDSLPLEEQSRCTRYLPSHCVRKPAGQDVDNIGKPIPPCKDGKQNPDQA